VPNPSDKSRPSASSPTIFTIRLTDDGLFVKRCELTDALQEIRAPGPEFIVLYIHGWKHNADPNDPDRIHFQQLLNKLNDREGLNPKRRIVGIYLAWNGNSVNTPVINNLTFWGRKKTADLIAQSAAVTKIVGAIEGIKKKRLLAVGRSEDVSMYIGHSFGARMLYSAVSQVMIHDVEFAFPDTMEGKRGIARNESVPVLKPYERVAGVGDLVVLLNPAFEASFYISFQTLLRSGSGKDSAREIFAPQQDPLMLTLASEHDLATRVAFPIGQVISLNVSEIRRTTLGNYAPAVTHELSKKNMNHVSQATTGESLGNWWFDDFCSSDLCLVRKSNLPASGDPFVVARTSSDIIADHNDIWTDALENFLADFMSNIEKRRDSRSL
jgi:hypothetical protein